MNPQTPWSDVFAQLEMAEYLPVKVWKRRKKLFCRRSLVPVVARVVTLFAREEAVVREKLAAVAGRQDDLVVVVMTAPASRKTRPC